MVSCSHILSAITILTQAVAVVNDFVRKVVKAGTGARRPVGSFSSSKLYKIAVLFSSAERSDARLLYKTIYFVSAGGARNVAEPKR